jgi:hypothetical protein
VALLLAVASAAAVGQGTVYESKDKAGPVFSDKPSAGAKPVDLPPPNVVAMPKVEPPAAAPSAASAPAYRSLAITSPVAQGTVHSNTGAFELSARLSPALRGDDRIVVVLDGQRLPTRYRSLPIGIGEADWQAAAGTERTDHTVQVAVVDSQGQILIDSKPVSFYVRRATVGGARR